MAKRDHLALLADRAPSGEIAAVAQGVVAQDRDDAEAMNRLVLHLSSGANDDAADS